MLLLGVDFHIRLSRQGGRCHHWLKLRWMARNHLDLMLVLCSNMDNESLKSLKICSWQTQFTTVCTCDDDTHIDWRPGLSVLCWHVPWLCMAAKCVRPLGDGEGWARCWASHDTAGHCRREHTQCPWWAYGMRARPLLLIFRGLCGLWCRCGRRRGLKVQVGHLWQWERHLSWMAHRVLTFSSRTTLMWRGGASVLQSTAGGAYMVGLLFWIALDVGSGLRQGRDRVQGEPGRALVGRRVCNLWVTASTLEAGPQVLAGWPAGVWGWPIVNLQHWWTAVHVRGEALQHWGTSLLDWGVVRWRGHWRVSLCDGRVTLRDWRVTLVVDGRVSLDWKKETWQKHSC